jgi:NTE family protein
MNPDGIVDRISLLIRQSGAFPSASDECIRSLANVTSWISVPGGSTLFSQGDPSSALFITISGLLGAYVRNGGDETLVGRVGPGELIGEMGCVTAEPRSATIRALRSAELLFVSWEAIEPLSRLYPELMLSLCRTVVGRMRDLVAGKPSQVRSRTFCVLPHGHHETTLAFVANLVAEFQKLSPTFLVTKQACEDFTTDSLFGLETAHEYVIYLADAGTTSWSRRCLRQADTVLIVAPGPDDPRPIEPLDNIVNSGISIELALLWPGKIHPGKTMPWLDALRPLAHHHVRATADIARMTRLLTGNGLGIVLSGGGARGLAHAGVARALQDHGIAIDAIVGTSIGALVGASLAMEWDDATSRARVHAFSRKHPLTEIMLPRHSLLSGRNLRASLENWYGDSAIEETPIRYACVSTNLISCGTSVHFRGKLKTWVRASASLPGIFPAVQEDGALHVDGGVVNNLPTDVIRGMGVGFVVGVDVGWLPEDSPSQATWPMPSIIEVMMRVSTMSSDARNLTLRQQCDVLLMPDVLSVNLMDFRAYARAMQAGHDCAIQKIEQIKRRLPDKITTARHSPL